MRIHLLFLAFLGLSVFNAPALDLPLLPTEKAVIDQIAALEGIELALAPKPGFSARAALEGLEWLGFEKAGLSTVTIHAKDAEKRAITITHDAVGHVLAITGNGPWLRNEGLKRLTGLPELRIIRLDHNTPIPKSGVDDALYSGAGFSALIDSKLAIVKIGHAFDDDGMAALAKVKSLRSVTIGHSKATDAGVAHFAKHPNLEEFGISPQARPNRFTDKSLAVLATLPKLKRLGLHETFLTYDGGLKFLKPLAGRLESVSFKGALVLPADVAKLKADHPGLKVETSTPAEILAAPNSRGVEKWASPEAVAYLKSAASK